MLISERTGAGAYGLLIMTRVLGKSEDEAREMIAKFANHMKNRKEHAYHYNYASASIHPASLRQQI